MSDAAAANENEVITTDVVIVGAGPCGLFAVFELGLLDIRDLPRRVLVGSNDGRVDKELLQVGIAA